MVNKIPVKFFLRFRYDFFSNGLSFGIENQYVIALEFYYFAISQYRALHLYKINIV